MRCASATASTIRKRTKHGALVDSLLLAEVYIELLGVRQAAFIDFAADDEHAARRRAGAAAAGQGRAASGAAARATERRGCEAAHAAFVETLGEKAIWRRFLAPADA